MESGATTVLLIDDDRDIREILSESLAAAGFAVTGAANGADALAALRAGLRPTAILLDLMMPALDGWDFLRELARDPRLVAIPVVPMTASPLEHDRARGHPLVRARLLKPFSLREVRRTVRALAA